MIIMDDVLADVKKDLTPRPLSWESSDVDWCEKNFQITTFIAEFWNTVSNILFFVIPPLLIYLFRQYATHVTSGVHLVWGLLVVVGAGSVYFHATLSLVGQLVDEIAIIWVFMAALALWYPKRYFPLFLDKNRTKFQRWMAAFTVLSTCLACVMPAVNFFALFILAIPATALLYVSLKRCKCPKVFHLGMRCTVIWILAIASWASDRLFCSMWERIGFPYMHCLWHIFIFLSSYQACVLFAYFDAWDEVPEQMPAIRYWPKDSWWWGPGVPYVFLKCAGYKPTHKSY